MCRLSTSTYVLKRTRFGFPVQTSRHPWIVIVSGHMLLDVSHWLSFLVAMFAAVAYAQFIYS